MLRVRAHTHTHRVNHACTPACIQHTSACMLTHIHCMHTCAYSHSQSCMHTHMHTTHACIHTCTHIAYIHVLTHACTHTHTHTFTHTHTHTWCIQLHFSPSFWFSVCHLCGFCTTSVAILILCIHALNRTGCKVNSWLPPCISLSGPFECYSASFSLTLFQGRLDSCLSTKVVGLCYPNRSGICFNPIIHWVEISQGHRPESLYQLATVKPVQSRLFSFLVFYVELFEQSACWCFSFC